MNLLIAIFVIFVAVLIGAFIYVLIDVVSGIYYGSYHKYRICLYADNFYYVEEKAGIRDWTKLCIPHEKYEDAIDYMNKTIKENQDRINSKKRVTVIYSEESNTNTVYLKGKISDLVSAVNENRKEDEEKIYNEIIKYFS